LEFEVTTIELVLSNIVR
jgi:hypothetical protein